MSEKINRKEKNQNIQVFVRLRPLNQRERDIRSLGVVEVVNNREVVVRQSQQTSHTKKFTFDRAFDPNAKQLEVYNEVVYPLIVEVLNGYNCTVFAYGQTGTGKTHTMVGENSGIGDTWQDDPMAGIIPRALSQLFDELRCSNTEFTVRVSYLELYNEELFDLLSTSEDNSKLRIYEDVTRKGSNIVNGLEEITVYSKQEVYKIMEQGQERKKVASTLMNAQSSRSHTVFTIVVHIKENSPEGEELVKIGKLNLVDLAGSENISKAGSDNPAKKERARECVNINQSLLTLGRVITALVERHPHIPYRESKLTRILQESLGGRTKTSIIATISPGHKDLEETMSTLEYAHRARHIQNKPEINQKMTKKAILKEYSEEIDRLKRDLLAARDKNGVYLANETFAEMTIKQEEQRKEIQDLLLRKRAMEEEKERMESVFSELNHTLVVKDTELSKTRHKLENTEDKLANTINVLHTTKEQFEEQKHIVSIQQETEVKLSTCAKQLLTTADVATEHVAKLHDTVDRRRSVERSNLQVTSAYREAAGAARETIVNDTQQFVHVVDSTASAVQCDIQKNSADSSEALEQNKQTIEELVAKLNEAVNEVKSQASNTHSTLNEMSNGHRSQLEALVMQHSEDVSTALCKLLHTVAAGVEKAGLVDVKGNVHNFVQQWAEGVSARLSSLNQSHSTFNSRASAASVSRSETARASRDNRRTRAQARQDKLKAFIDEINKEKQQIEMKLSQQQLEIETERKETELRLKNWEEEERRLMEEKVARHLAVEKQILEDRLKRKMEYIEEQKTQMEERVRKYIELQEIQLQENSEDFEVAEVDLVEFEKQQETNIEIIQKYDKEFGDGVNAISTDIEVFSRNVVDVVEHINNNMMKTIRDAKDDIEHEVNSLVSTDKQTAQQFIGNTSSMLSTMVDNNRKALEYVVQNFESSTKSTSMQLSTLSSTATSLVSASQQHVAVQNSTLQQLRQHCVDYNNRVCDQVTRQAELEGQLLSREYKVYTPSGSTPVRQEYCYPRALPATSPHERLLRRYRAARELADDEECIVVEDDESSSGSESTMSEPSPPHAASPVSVTPAHHFKSNSDTELICAKMQQGKENGDRSINSTLKRPSRLPAPANAKKPLSDRNG